MTGLQRALVLSCLLVASLGSAGCGEPERRPRGVVLVVLDTLRADGLSTLGNARPTSPVIDALGRRGVVFEQVISHAAWTLPGFVGLLSARYPAADVYADGRLLRSTVSAFRDAGYATAAFTEGAYVSEDFGTDRGFDAFEANEAQIRLGPGRPLPGPRGIAHTFARAGAWLEANADAPFFLLVHTYEPHLPYRRRLYAESLPSGAIGETYEVRDARAVSQGEVVVGDTERAYVRALYDGGVRVADAHVGKLFETLQRLGIAQETIVAVTSDHGEDLGGRSPTDLGRHQHHLHDELLHVPLVIYDPLREWPKGRVASQVRLVDVMPTLLELAGAPVPGDLDGRSLTPLMAGRESADRPAFATLAEADRLLLAVRSGGAKLIVEHDRSTRADRPALYDLAADPGEREDVAGTGRPEEAPLTALLDATRRRLEAAGRARLRDSDHLGPERVAELEALGYVEDGSQRPAPGPAQ